MDEMTDKEFEAVFDPMWELADRWGITEVEAEEFLEVVGYLPHRLEGGQS